MTAYRELSLYVFTISEEVPNALIIMSQIE